MKFHEQHPYVTYTKLQIQEKEKELKREYRMIKEARHQSGVSWNEKRWRIEAEEELWDNLMIVSSFAPYKFVRSLHNSVLHYSCVCFCFVLLMCIFLFCITHVYVSILQSFPKIGKFRTKGFPHFEALGEL